MSTILDMGIPGIGSGILQPKKQNLWRVTFAGLGGGSNSQPISMQSKQIQRPKLSFEKVELHRYNSVSMIAGKHKWEPITLTLEDDVTGTATTAIQQQLQMQQWLIGAEGQWLAVASEGSIYKFVTYLDMMDGNDQVIERWTIEGCWFENVDWSDLDYSTGEAVNIVVTISLDHARQNIGGYQGGPGIATGGVGTI